MIPKVLHMQRDEGSRHQSDEKRANKCNQRAETINKGSITLMLFASVPLQMQNLECQALEWKFGYSVMVARGLKNLSFPDYGITIEMIHSTLSLAGWRLA
jgi:hypothetical protein